MDSLQTPLRILILGGTTEARRLCERLEGDACVTPILSLAGRTKTPALPKCAYRVGGFGGIAGLMSYLQNESIDFVIDATHPFAEQMSAHAEAACSRTAIALALLTRAAWSAQDGDRWSEVESAQAAARALGESPRRVFLTVGRLQVPAFEAAPVHHYLIRSIDVPEPPPKLPNHRLLLARGPFSVEDELHVMMTEKIDILVSKNSGGEATYAKIEAARKLRIPVVLMRPPARADVSTFHDLDAMLAFIRDIAHQRGTEPRGV
jgi:precorrin-6A/cobalt-precorrin-6A reductase